MSLPPELRVLCFQLSSTPSSDLPRLTPTLLRHVLRCQVPLSSPAMNASRADASASSVLVHKLKTQLSTLLNGRSPEGKFTAAILIKAVVEVGGWEVLRGTESWVRGLLSLLGKSDASATKEMCILALTKIYCMTHQYQSLIREITTPTLPAFVTSCLNLVSSKASTKTQDVPSSLLELVFQSFAMLIPRHTTIFRPFASQIRSASRPFLAPTSSDGILVSSTLKDSARRVHIILHQTVAKNAGGEEWGKAVRGFIKDIHVTADSVFRAVVEDWESTTGYLGEPVDVNQELSGGGNVADDLPTWAGIDAGVERLTGLLELLSAYLMQETSTPVSIPLSSLLDMVTRMLSIALPLESQPTSESGPRQHPAIDRDEKDGLWSGMPQIYIAALQLVRTIADRTQESFVSLAQASFDLVVWVFPYGKHCPEFRVVAYIVAAKILHRIGQSLDKSSTEKFGTVYQSCCHDLLPVDPSSISNSTIEGSGKNAQGISSSHQNADTLLRGTVGVTVEPNLADDDLSVAASGLLPLLLSHLPQQYLNVSQRAMVERSAVLTRNKSAMLASVLNPFMGKHGTAMATLLPHLTREFGSDDCVEILLRPRMPLLPFVSAQAPINDDGLANSGDLDEEMEYQSENASNSQAAPSVGASPHAIIIEQAGLGSSSHGAVTGRPVANFFGADDKASSTPSIGAPLKVSDPPLVLKSHVEDVQMAAEEDSSDDESVHLTMQLDTDSEDGME